MQNSRLEVIQLRRKDHLLPPLFMRKDNNHHLPVLIQTFQSGDYLFISIHGFKAFSFARHPQKAGQENQFCFLDNPHMENQSN